MTTLSKEFKRNKRKYLAFIFITVVVAVLASFGAGYLLSLWQPVIFSPMSDASLFCRWLITMVILLYFELKLIHNDDITIQVLPDSLVFKFDQYNQRTISREFHMEIKGREIYLYDDKNNRIMIDKMKGLEEFLINVQNHPEEESR